MLLIMVQEFRHWLEFERRLSKHTVTSYMNDLEQFNQYLKENYPDTEILQVQAYHVKNWLVDFIDKKYTSTTVSRKIVSLNTFYKYMIREEKTDNNPALRIKAPKAPKRLVSFLEESDLIKILDNFEYADDFCGIRDKMILEMLYGTGIRLSELIGLKDSDIDISTSSIRVLGKRNKERIIPINNTLLTIIDAYKEKRILTFGAESDNAFLLTSKGKKLYPMFVYRTVKNYLDVFESKTKVSPHVLRHTFATHLLNRGADINAIKELLGHANLAATQVYTHNTIERLKKIHKQAHPRG